MGIPLPKLMLEEHAHSMVYIPRNVNSFEGIINGQKAQLVYTSPTPRVLQVRLLDGCDSPDFYIPRISYNAKIGRVGVSGLPTIFSTLMAFTYLSARSWCAFSSFGTAAYVYTLSLGAFQATGPSVSRPYHMCWRIVRTSDVSLETVSVHFDAVISCVVHDNMQGNRIYLFPAGPQRVGILPLFCKHAFLNMNVLGKEERT